MPLHSYKKGMYGQKKKSLILLSYGSMTLGVLFLFWSFYPIIAFEIYSRLFINQEIKSPIGSQDTTALKKSSSTTSSDKKYTTNLADYTKASVWFPSAYDTSATKKEFTISEYKLSIPKLGIENARVFLGGEDLLSGLVDYLPQNLPGEYGTKSIFGHSTLLQNYNPKDYSSIFSYVPTLETNDIIIVTVGDTAYEYAVFDKFIIDPDQVSVLEQKYDHSYLNLITCTPPGTYYKRAVVQAKLKQLPQKAESRSY